MIKNITQVFWSATCRSPAISIHPREEQRSNPSASLGECQIGLLGIPDDTGVALNGGRVGARFGPAAFRDALSRYGVERPIDGGSAYPQVYDFGDVTPGSGLDETHSRVTEAAAQITGNGLLPIAIGGGHDLTFAFVRGVLQTKRLTGGVYLDAHLDVRPEPGSGMSFRRLIEDCGIHRLTCVGCNRLVNSAAHLDWFQEHGGSIKEFAPEAWPVSDGQFVSVDLDVMGGAFAPGVSAVNPTEGIKPSDAAEYAYCAGRYSGVKCFDIMELNPTFDEGNRTALLAAHIFLSFLRGFSERPQSLEVQQPTGPPSTRRA